MARLDRVVFGPRDPKAGMVRTHARLLEHDQLNHRAEVDEGVEAGGGRRTPSVLLPSSPMTTRKTPARVSLAVLAGLLVVVGCQRPDLQPYPPSPPAPSIDAEVLGRAHPPGRRPGGSAGPPSGAGRAGGDPRPVGGSHDADLAGPHSEDGGRCRPLRLQHVDRAGSGEGRRLLLGGPGAASGSTGRSADGTSIPLALVLDEARERGLRVHAWLNTHLVTTLTSLPSRSRARVT